MHVDFHKLKLTRGSSYLPLPKNFSGKFSVINPKNEEDDECFRWAVLAALYHDKIDNHPERISILKKYEDKCNWNGLSFPMALNKIDLFERRNPDIAVHVLTKDDVEGVYMCRRSKHLDRKETDNDAAKVQLPKEGSTLTFTDGKFQLKVPFIIYADFEAFTQELPEDERKGGSSTEKVEMDPLTDEERDGFNRSEVCHICMKEFDGDDDIKVRDHCHFTGACKKVRRGCGLNNLSANLPGVNNMRCDKCSSGCSFEYIDENYIAHGKCGECDVGCNRNLDKQSLLEKFRNMHTGNDEQFRFNETELPSKDDFYSELNMSHISDADYEHAQKVWKAFDIKDLGEYHDIYLNTDVLLLAGVFETFRETCLRYYKLDPAHFYTTPGLTWQACLKKTGVSLDLLSDIEMVTFIESGIKGGLCQAVHRHAKANHSYMGDIYNTSEDTTYLQYLDANNLFIES
ncbi:uncharacterized protein LOC130646086 [Hydractinia symbiolongicarpus]|uniref:uncharacterized protein LOC130646086 n=1 Tax=Hydractinia symbiolongicarpus TaxID=13093 RepID=UPI00254C2DD7|nr:uncharacterized protein LOC130646086 [Hydractinia symbiolongicarpus]